MSLKKSLQKHRARTQKVSATYPSFWSRISTEKAGAKIETTTLPFLQRLQTAEPYETWFSMYSAAEKRYYDALELAINGTAYSTGAIYLFGYVAEMCLKTAYFQFVGELPTADLMSKSGPISTAMKSPYFTGGNKKAHDLVCWANLIIGARRAKNNPLSPILVTELSYHVDVLANDWTVDLRYKFTNATPLEIEDVLVSVDWLRNNYDSLWR